MMNVMRCSKCVFLLIAVVLSGCGGSKADVSPVRGRVTLDGQPLPFASVVFELPGKLPGGGYTDKDGNYELMYKRGIKGAPVGTNRVAVLEDTQRTHKPQRVPARYNENSELKAEVKPGDNVIDFALTTEK